VARQSPRHRRSTIRERLWFGGHIGRVELRIIAARAGAARGSPPMDCRHLCPTGKSQFCFREYMSSQPTKNILLFRINKSAYRLDQPASPQGTFRDRHGAWCGLRWARAGVRRDLPAGRNAGSARRNRRGLAPRPWRLSVPVS
jgi:hypothetical protein